MRWRFRRFSRLAGPKLSAITRAGAAHILFFYSARDAVDANRGRSFIFFQHVDKSQIGLPISAPLLRSLYRKHTRNEEKSVINEIKCRNWITFANLSRRIRHAFSRCRAKFVVYLAADECLALP
jgi:hypothetical protein